MSMPIRSVSRVWLILLTVFAPAAQATDVAGLYTAQVEVTDRSAAELRRGASQAFEQVMIKLTGAKNPQGIRPLVSRAAEFLFQYTYVDDLETGKLMLNASFDSQVMVPEIEALGLAIWGKERPDTLVYLVIDSESGREIINSDADHPLKEVLQARARARGIPLFFPLEDIEFATGNAASSDWQGIVDSATEVASPYAAPALLVGHLAAGGFGFWESRWAIVVDDEQYQWQQEGDLAELLIEDGADSLADALARRFADPSLLNRTERLVMTIHGVNSVARYASVTRYLRGLDAVSDVFVSRVGDQSIEVQLTARGGRAGLDQSVSFGGVLTPRAAGAYELTP